MAQMVRADRHPHGLSGFEAARAHLYRPGLHERDRRPRTGVDRCCDEEGERDTDGESHASSDHEPMLRPVAGHAAVRVVDARRRRRRSTTIAMSMPACRVWWRAQDTNGNAYLSCQMFMRGDAVTNNPDESSAFYVFRSTGTGGASWNFPARPAELNDVAGAGDALLDKQYMTVDDHRGSPFQDRVYVTWTLFAPDGTAYIYEAYSRDYAESFSSPKLSARPARCARTHSARRLRKAPATATSSHSRSPAPTARSMWSGTTTT
jgi:hypothetical protein